MRLRGRQTLEAFLADFLQVRAPGDWRSTMDSALADFFAILSFWIGYIVLHGKF